MKLLLSTVALFTISVSSFPTELLPLIAQLQTEGINVTGSSPVSISKARTNCGVVPCGTFNAADQTVSTTGEHAYASPAVTDIRGPCPGLNAAANHGYLPRSGVATALDTITGLGELYGMSADLAGFLAAYAIIMDGDILAGTWSIGGPSKPSLLGLLGGSEGISYSHNIYESDASFARADAYLNNGDAHSLNLTRFKTAYETGMSDDSYTLDLFAQLYANNTQLSTAENPCFFLAPFSGLVSIVAYNFVINYFSNHSAEQPNGYLNGEMLKTWFAVTGDYPNFEWQPGQERIPDNWYTRPTTAPYSLPAAFLDLAVDWAAYPATLTIGGNSNGVNTFTGIDLADLTGSAYHTADLLDPSKAKCFYAQLVQALVPENSLLGAVTGELADVLSLLSKYVKPITKGLGCKPLKKFSQTPLSSFPGFKYRPTGTATNYKE